MLNYNEDFYQYLGNLFKKTFKSGTVSVFYGKSGTGKTTVLMSIADGLSVSNGLKVLLLSTEKVEFPFIHSINGGCVDIVTIDHRWNMDDFNKILTGNGYGAIVIDELYPCIDGYNLGENFIRKVAVKFNVPVFVSVNGYGLKNMDEVLDNVYANEPDSMAVLFDLVVYLERDSNKFTLTPVKNKWDVYDTYEYTIQ